MPIFFFRVSSSDSGCLFFLISFCVFSKIPSVIIYFVWKVAQLCLSLCDSVDCSLPGYSVHGISQARILECVVISYSRGSSCPRDRTHIFYVSCICRQILYHCAIWETQSYIIFIISTFYVNN